MKSEKSNIKKNQKEKGQKESKNRTELDSWRYRMINRPNSEFAVKMKSQRKNTIMQLKFILKIIQNQTINSFILQMQNNIMIITNKIKMNNLINRFIRINPKMKKNMKMLA